MPPALVPTAIAMLAVFGMGAIPVMATALDDDGLGTGYCRRRDRDSTEGCDDISKLLHVVLSSHFAKIKLRRRRSVPMEPRENSEQVFS
jgi:hypothetical protein